MKKNWKSSLTGVLTAGVALATFYHVIPAEAGVPITALGMAILGLLINEDTTPTTPAA